MTRARAVSLPDDVIVSKIHEFRGQRVMLDRDLAELFAVSTKALKQAVRRNRERFPEDFLFEMNAGELEALRADPTTSEPVRKGLRYPPFCFTEPGVTMLACVLSSDVAITMNIKIIRVFLRLRDTLRERDELLARVRAIESRIGDHDEALRLLTACLQEVTPEPSSPRRPIGYRRQAQQ